MLTRRLITLARRLVNQPTGLIQRLLQPQISQTSRQSYAARLSALQSSNHSRSLYMAVGSVMLFSWTAHAASDISQRPGAYSEAFHNEAASPILKQLIFKLYPDCHQEILSVYEAVGIIPLLNKALLNKQLENPVEAIQCLNKYLQAILLRPKDMPRFSLNDKSYLFLVQDRLYTAYQEAGLSHPPRIDAERLRNLLMQPALWTETLCKPVSKIDAALIMGSTYQDYLNHQNCFFQLIKNIPVRLGTDGFFPVYLLGGNHPLDKAMDAVMIPRLTELEIPLNEQNMINFMFDEALKHYSGDPALKQYSTHSSGGAGARLTTADTLDSVMQMLKQDAQVVLVISSAPFVRYQKLVTERQFLKQGRDMTIVATGCDLATTMETHPQLAKGALIAITLDNLAREVYEMSLIASLKKELVLSESSAKSQKSCSK